MELNEYVLAQLCRLAYKDPVDLKDTLFDRFRMFRGLQVGGTECIIAEDHGTVVVAIRGTQTKWLDWLRDLQFLWPRPIHRGFRRSADQLARGGVWDIIESLEPTSLWFIGHSLGGGVAAVLSSYALSLGCSPVPHLMTMGQPRTGLSKWSRTLSESIEAGGGSINRFVHPLDIVPHAPPAGLHLLPQYRHHGPTRLIVDDATIVPDATLQEGIAATAWQAFSSPRRVAKAHSSETYCDSLRDWVRHCEANGQATFISHDTEG